MILQKKKMQFILMILLNIPCWRCFHSILVYIVSFQLEDLLFVFHQLFLKNKNKVKRRSKRKKAWIKFTFQCSQITTILSGYLSSFDNCNFFTSFLHFNSLICSKVSWIEDNSFSCFVNLHYCISIWISIVCFVS